MQRSEIITGLDGILNDYLARGQFDLVDFTHRYEGKDLILRIIVDKPGGGISIDECAQINASLGRILEEKNLLQQRYILEVSSPGLDRPLINRKDFLRCTGRRVRFFLNEPVEGKIEIEACIKEVRQDSVAIDREGLVIDIPLAKINRAKQVF